MADNVKKIYDHKNQLKSQIMIQPNGRELETEFYPNGKPRVIAEYRDGVLDGVYKEYYANGYLKEHSGWCQGHKQGMCATFFDNGQLAELTHIGSNRAVNGVSLQFFSNGVLRSQKSFKDGVAHGPFLERAENGMLYESGAFHHGQLNGEYRSYFPNGQVWEKVNYYNNRYDGDYHLYYENGQIQIQAEYIDGMKDGEYQSFYDDGTPRVQAFYKHDYRIGTYCRFYPNGQLKVSCHYSADVPSELVGDFKIFTESGQLAYLAKYDQGDKITAVIWDGQESEENMIKRAQQAFDAKMAEIHSSETQSHVLIHRNRKWIIKSTQEFVRG